MFQGSNFLKRIGILFISLLLPEVILAGISSIRVEAPVLQQIIINGDSIVLGPLRKNFTLDFRHHNIVFVFTGNDTSAYQFMLIGFDKKWSSPQSASFKEYTNLPAGDYQLKVRCIYKNDPPAELVLPFFKVLSRWYSSPMALILYMIAAGLAIWAFYTSMNLRFARTQYILEQIINKRTEDLIIEKEKTEKLLANVLPRNTASEIMEKGKATKIKYNFVTVLFSDIQGFTKIAEETNPEVLIDELDKFFFYFDSVVERLGIEKIKTIGDAYMCAGGIPEKNRTNPVEVILAALEMQIYMANLKETSELEGMKYWDIRIGIHTGTIVAGVVGQRKLSYDIWGDTVNTASRMESSGEAGKINISGTTYEFVKDFFSCEHRGKMPVKYKGELDMYFVNGIIPELRNENGKPNRRFILKMQMLKLQDVEETIIKLFEDEASPDLYFHNSSLVKSISSQADLLATAERIPEEDFLRLKLAALFLFIGYISDYEKPMDESLQNAEETLPKYGFDQSEIDDVKELIRNSFTDVQKSENDKILHDARYDYLGRVDFIKLSEKLLREESENGIPHEKKEWTDIQRKLLVEHEFLTNTGKLLRSVPVEDQVSALLSS